MGIGGACSSDWDSLNRGGNSGRVRVHISKIPSDAPPIIFHIGDHWLQFGWKEFCLITGFRFGIVSEKHKKLSPFCQRVFPEKVTKTGVKKLKSCELLKLLRNKKGWLALSDMDAVKVCLLIVVELVFMGKEDMNFIPRHIVSLVEDWMRGMTILRVSILNVDLYSTPAEMRAPWFIASIPLINGLVDEDMNVFLDDCVGVSKDNVVDGQHQLGYDTERVNETLVENNERLLLEKGDGVLDSEGGGRNPESDNVKQPANVSIVELFAEVRSLRQEVTLIKVDDERISNVERL
ncbi:phospholipase-like protein [Tanacetum coccineum]